MSTTSNPPASSSTATVAAARPSSATTKTPPRPHPTPSHYPPIQPHLYVRPQPPQFLNPNSPAPTPNYPLASTGRGFLTRPLRPPDHPTPTIATLAPASAAAYHARAVGVPYRPPLSTGSPRAHPHMDLLSRQHPTTTHLPHHHQQQPTHYVGAPIKGIPVTGQVKAAPTPVADSNGYKNMRDRSRDDSFVTIRDRKVRISDGASLYAVCRSWLRNGFPEESQPHYGDGLRSLPRPLPLPVLDTHSPKKEEGEEVEEHEEDEESVNHLSTQDLLQRHIKRAKKVRSRLREQRLKRIARYKTRLALLLPPQVEQLKNEPAA